MNATEIKTGHSYERRIDGTPRVVIRIDDDRTAPSGKRVVFHGGVDLGACDLQTFASFSDREAPQG